MTTVEVFAPAKINLTLHVTGQRDDGYHLLDSLVAFAQVGDIICVNRSEVDRFTVSGQFAAVVPTTDDNLVLKALGLFDAAFDVTLQKNLPVASGIGGGSADAAAAMKAASQLLNVPMPDRDAQMSLGADVPVCVAGGLVRMRGIGEELEIIDTGGLGWPLVLVNPKVPVSTPEVFRALATKENAPMASPFDLGPVPHQQDEFIGWLAQQRNDLQAPAIQIVPTIGGVLNSLRDQSGCLLSRMSGSGATCFGIFADDEDARTAAKVLAERHPEWWVAASTGPGF